MDSREPPSDQYLTTREAGNRMRLPEKDVRALCRSGELKEAWQPRQGGPWMIPKATVDAWVLLHQSRHDPVSRLRSSWIWLKRHPWLALPLAVIPVVVAVMGFLADVTGLVGFVSTIQGEKGSAVIPMEGDYNVAVAGFEILGTGSGMESATELTNNIANAIDREIGSMEQQMGQRIDIRLPARVGTISGATEKERAMQASVLAQALNAHLVIYGVVEVDGASAHIKPEFYVRSDGFSEAAEITGQYRIGSPVPIEKVENIALRREVSGVIESRFRALTFVIYGLADLAVGKYDGALTSLQQALETKAWDNPDVLYVLLGNSALRLGDMDQAKRNYESALAVNPSFSRAYVGLGSTSYMMALGNVSSNSYDSVDLDLLDQAIGQYQHALDETMEHPPLAEVPSKARLGLGQSYLLKAQTLGAHGDTESQAQYTAMAVQAFHAVASAFTDGENSRVQELAAHAHAHLGLIHYLGSEYQQAITEYEQAITLLPDLDKNRERRAMYEAAIAEIYAVIQLTEKAADWYQRAIADSPPDSEQQLMYQAKLEALP